MIVTLNVSSLKAQMRVDVSGDWSILQVMVEGEVSGTCQMTTAAREHSVALTFEMGDRGISVRITNAGWNFSKAAVKVPVVLRFDGADFGRVSATASKSAGNAGTPDADAKAVSAIEFGIPLEHFESFMRHFGDAREMQVKFPESSVKPWSARMKGSRKAMDLFHACLQRLLENYRKSRKS